MMTQQLQVSILAAPLGAIDRRVLPQAWCDALGIARSRAASAHQGARRIAAGAVARSVSASYRSEKSAAGQAQTMAARPARTDAARWVFAPIEDGGQDRAIAPLSRRIERRFAGAKMQPQRATFSLGRGSARIHVILQTTGSTATLLAICRPEMRSVVARALAGARLALAARGVAFNAEGEGVRACT
jgi:hypothetical protein